MVARNSSGVERRRGRVDGNRPRTHPKPPGRKATRFRTASAERRTRPDEDGDVLEGLSRAISLVETAAIAMQMYEDDSEMGPIAEALNVACCELRRMYGAVDLALRQVKP